jgi:hypothetical protein
MTLSRGAWGNLPAYRLSLGPRGKVWQVQPRLSILIDHMRQAIAGSFATAFLDFSVLRERKRPAEA